MFITGPSVIAAVTGESVTAEELGGARTHNAISGVAHYMAEDEEDCIRQIKELLGYLPQNNMETPPEMESGDDWNRQDDFLNELIPENPGKPYDMKTVIEALADNGRFMEYQEYFAPNLITGFIHMGGRSTGVIPLIYRSLHWWMCRDFCLGRCRSTTELSATAPSCCMPTVRRWYRR